jgi:hypothetical protein
VGGKQKAQLKGEADHPLAQWYIGKHFIDQQGCRDISPLAFP